MYSIALRELRFYFGNISGYILLIIYLSINTLLLWFFDSPYNVLNFNFGDLSPFFFDKPFSFMSFDSSTKYEKFLTRKS